MPVKRARATKADKPLPKSKKPASTDPAAPLSIPSLLEQVPRGPPFPAVFTFHISCLVNLYRTLPYPAAFPSPRLQLSAEPIRHVNLLSPILAAIDPRATFDAAHTTAAATQGLRIFFLGALTRGHLAPSAGQGAARLQKLPPFEAFVSRAYVQFKAACRSVLLEGREAAMQAVALNALMDLVRSERVGELK